MDDKSTLDALKHDSILETVILKYCERAHAGQDDTIIQIIQIMPPKQKRYQISDWNLMRDRCKFVSNTETLMGTVIAFYGWPIGVP